MGSLRGFSQRKLMDHLYDFLHVFNRRSGNNSVTQVEDVTGSRRGGEKNFFDADFENFKRRKQGDWVEISLHSTGVAHCAPPFIEGLTPIEANHVSAR
jgi:hypothetical protein